ncbi:MAG: hypothetical protein GY928_33960 [Colwellia sp.]|nr:hypothetical protein [Colwellia sp.]
MSDMNYRVQLLESLEFAENVNAITRKAKQLSNMNNRAALYEVLMDKSIESLRNDSNKAEFCHHIEDWARRTIKLIKENSK